MAQDGRIQGGRQQSAFLLLVLGERKLGLHKGTCRIEDYI